MRATLTDEQMVEALKDAGHIEAATALEQKLNAQAAVASSARAASPSAAATGEPIPGQLIMGHRTTRELDRLDNDRQDDH